MIVRTEKAEQQLDLFRVDRGRESLALRNLLVITRRLRTPDCVGV